MLDIKDTETLAIRKSLRFRARKPLESRQRGSLHMTSRWTLSSRFSSQAIAAKRERNSCPHPPGSPMGVRASWPFLDMLTAHLAAFAQGRHRDGMIPRRGVTCGDDALTLGLNSATSALKRLRSASGSIVRRPAQGQSLSLSSAKLSLASPT